MNSINIHEAQLPIVEYQGQRVITFAMVDLAHNRLADTAASNFRKNRDRFIEGEDFFELGSGEISRHLPQGTFSKFAASGIVLTESGYLMLAKSLTDDLAWSVQRQLVKGYFRQQQEAPKTQNEIIAAMALANVEQERRLNHVEEKVDEVAASVQRIKQGAIPAGWVGYSLLRTKTGLTDAKVRTLAKVYGVPVDKITILTPDGQPRPMAIVKESVFITTFKGMMTEAERRGTKWYHPNMGLFQVIGWREK